VPPPRDQELTVDEQLLELARKLQKVCGALGAGCGLHLLCGCRVKRADWATHHPVNHRPTQTSRTWRHRSPDYQPTMTACAAG